MPAVALGLGLALPDLVLGAQREAAVGLLLLLALGFLLARAGRPRAAEAALVAAAFALGAHAGLPLALPPEPLDLSRSASEAPRPAVVEGRIAGDVAAVPGSAWFDLDVKRARLAGEAVERSGRLRVSVEGLPEDGVPVVPWRRGDLLELTGLLRLPRDFATPGVASRVASLERRGVRALLVVKAPELVRRVTPARRGPVGACREALLEAVATYVAGGRRASRDPGAAPGFEVVPESRAASVLGAMLADDRAALDASSTRHLAEAGMIHVLSISGLHVALVGGAAFLVAGLLVGGAAPRAALALFTVLLYVAVAGAPAPAVRAAIVTGVVLVGTSLHREAPGVNALALAFLAGGVLEPGGLGDPGFQLTYAAAAGLLLVAPPVARALRRVLPRWVALPLATSLGAEAAVLPLALHHFGRVSLAGPLLNLAAVPLAGFAVIAGLLLPIAAALHPALGRLVGAAAAVAVELLFLLAEPRGVPFALRLVPPPPILVALALAAALVAVCGRSRPRLRAGLLVSAYAALVLVPPLLVARPDGSTRVHFLDVGQGDAALVELPAGGTVLVDAGGLPRSRFDVGDRVVVPFLLTRGHRSLDLAVVTHAHPDHAAGMLAVLREIAVRELWLGDEPFDDPLAAELRRAAAERGTRVVDARRGLRREVEGGSRIHVLNPESGLGPPAEVENSRSIVAHVLVPGGAFLLTGDIHADAEGRLAASGRVRSDVLKVAHHGSRTSSAREFLAAVGARAAVVSCGAFNRFGHPDRGVLEALTGARSAVLRTDLSGTVTVTLTPQGRLLVRGERERRHHAPAP